MGLLLQKRKAFFAAFLCNILSMPFLQHQNAPNFFFDMLGALQSFLVQASVAASGAAGQVGAQPPQAASTSPGESRAIHRICGNRCYPRIDLDHGNNFLHREGATGAAIRRNRKSPLAPSLP